MGIFRGIYRMKDMQFCCLEEGMSGKLAPLRRYPDQAENFRPRVMMTAPAMAAVRVRVKAAQPAPW